MGISGMVNTVAGQSEAGDEFPPVEQTEYSDPVPFGDGEMKTFVTEFSDEEVTYVGVELSGAAATIDPEEYDEVIMRSIPFPEGTQFEYLAFDWNPYGHAPEGVYDVPHHDIHFYLESQEVIAEIPPINFDVDELEGIPDELLEEIPDPVEEPYEEPIAADQYPEGYVRDNSVVPLMGEQMYDTTSPEWDGPGEPSGEPFTHTHVWGHWDGDLIFYEPMISVDFFADLEGSVTEEITTPKRMPEAGEYPTEYTVTYHPNRDAYTVTLGAFEFLEESTGCTDAEITVGDNCAAPYGDDGLYRDVDGSGTVGNNDVVQFFQHLEDDAIQQNVGHFDFSGSGSVGFGDVIALFEQL